MIDFKISYLWTIPKNTLINGLLAQYHVRKTVKFKEYPHVMAYHRDMVRYYYKKAFGVEPKFGGKK